VVSAGFGFDKLIERIGIERRVHTQGEAKAMLDPFRPENPEDIVRLKAIQADVQDLFTTLVSERRPAVRASGDNLFTGAVWTGRQALPLGLIDGLGDARSTLRARFGDDVVLKVVAEKQGSFVSRLLRRAVPGSTVVDGLAADALAAVEERAAWARYGL
jgi:ClpP class serine protease